MDLIKKVDSKWSYFRILLLCSLFFLSCNGTAQGAVSESDFSINSYGVITAYSGSGGDINIPSNINGIVVTGIGDSVFANNDTIASVVIPSGVTSIGKWAFSDCSQLTGVTLSEDLKSIDIAAFASCPKLNNVDIPGTVEVIGSSAFCNCTELSGITIPGKVTTIASYLFFGCTNLTSATIPNGVESIGESAFFRTGLESIVIPNSVKTIGYQAFMYCTSLANVSLGNNVTTINTSAFQGCTSLTAITIPASVVNMMNLTFADCRNLTDVTLTDGMKSMGTGTFAGCSKLVNLKLANTLTTIGYYGFHGCSALKALEIPDGIKYIDADAFSECTGLTSVDIPASVIRIQNLAFYKCSNLAAAYFYGNAPAMGGSVFNATASGFKVYYLKGNTTFTNPWYGYTTAEFALKAPMLNAEEYLATGSEVNICFSDNENWRNAITGIYVDGTDLQSDQYSVTAGNIAIAAEILTDEKSYQIFVTATAYEDAPIVIITDPDSWSLQKVVLRNISEAELEIRVGDIDNLNFGWPDGFEPFSGESTPVHSYPWAINDDDASGTDRIFVVSSYNGNPPYSQDGYTNETSRPDNSVESIVLEYEIDDVIVNTAILQMFVDDFQAQVWGANYQVTLNGQRAPFLENILNSIEQTGPIGKLITVQIPAEYLSIVQSGRIEILIDDTTTGAGDGYAIDFARLLINPKSLQYTGTIQGTVQNEEGDSVSGATISASGTMTTCESDSNGKFILTDVCAGLVVLNIEAYNYQAQTLSVDLKANEIVTVTVVLNSLPTSPYLTADDTDNYQGSIINLEFEDDEDWRSAITAVKVDGTELTESQYSVVEGMIRISEGVLTTAGNHTIVVSATGYLDASVTQPIEVTDVPVTGVTLNINELEMTVGGSGQLTATIEPFYATNLNIIWTSENESIATVDNNGLVQAVLEGTTYITAETEDGGYTAICTITVKPKPPAVELSDKVIYVTTDNTYVYMKILGTFLESEGYEIVEKGFISIKNPETNPGTRLTLEADGITIIQAPVTNAAGQVYRSIKTLYGNTFYVRSYLIYTDPGTGETVTIYSDQVVKAVKTK